MKITPASRVAIEPVAPRATPAPRPAARDGATLSSAGSLVSELRAEAAAHGVEGDVRPDVVARMKAEIADGRLGTPEDVERAIDALLQEL